MARVTKTPIGHHRDPTTQHPNRPQHNYAGQAAAQAHATYGPQIHGVRQDLHGQVRSLNSEGAALQNSLTLARRNIRHSGLQGDDLALALKELAYRSADVGAGTQLQIQTARQDAHGEVQNLLQSQGAAQQSLLAEMQKAAQARQQELIDDTRNRRNDIKDAITLEELKKRLGLGSYADDGSGSHHGLTATQRRAIHEERDTAGFYAKTAFDALKESGKVPEDPNEWDDATWNALVGGVHQQKGVESADDAARAVSNIRDHFGGGGVQGFDPADAGGGGGGDMDFLKALFTLARGAAPLAGALVAPGLMQPQSQGPQSLTPPGSTANTGPQLQRNPGESEAEFRRRYQAALQGYGR